MSETKIMDGTGKKGRNKLRRVRISVRGRVQGVGFRPELYRRLTALGCGGHVKNTPQGVCVEVEADSARVEHVIGHFSELIPAGARLDSLEVCELPPAGERSFRIESSCSAGDSLLPIPPDFAACAACAQELAETGGRRTSYAFNTCTCCGPRFSIAAGIPFDRGASAMDGFPLCSRCRREFGDPANRRFHAQTMSCPDCGPEVAFFYTGRPSRVISGISAIAEAAGALATGRAAAIKGLGGFHLACDASDDSAVGRIRAGKGRPHKPLGVMAADIKVARRIAVIGAAAEEMLCSERAPMVLAEKKDSALLSPQVAPRLGRVGVLLPYTPLHRLLFAQPGIPPVLVMTSCNRSEEPIAVESETVAEKLADMVDCVLDHNRPITNRCDDSVLGPAAGSYVVFRRSRGYVPEPLMLKSGTDAPPALAAGAMWKNTFTLTKSDMAFMSQHIGDVSDADNAAYFEETVDKFSQLLRIKPELIACDMHPDYPTTAFARRYAASRGLPLVGVQHHFAHILSCLADRCEPGPVIGVSMDGTGYGEDGCVWGGEFLIADRKGYERRLHLKYVPMPGGEKAVSEPYRMALSYLDAAFGRGKAMDFMAGIAGGLPLEQVCSLIGSEFSPLTSSCGRLFDAVASLLGIAQRCTYEGQAACELEAVAHSGESKSYSFDTCGNSIVFSETIAGICEDIRAGKAPGIVSARFHNTVAKAVTEACAGLREEEKIGTVALSGGVMQNSYLLGRCVQRLTERGFNVLTHKDVPPNDAGISLGQAVHAATIK